MTTQRDNGGWPVDLITLGQGDYQIAYVGTLDGRIIQGPGRQSRCPIADIIVEESVPRPSPPSPLRWLVAVIVAAFAGFAAGALIVQAMAY